ncbi:alpha/beta hydrolase [Paenibacillus sp. SC116]|uniref:alpha/beta hydrolase n=1 Tax=Paenibacillus sp. SC116 TaxID=2968986 RepID=UPI00215A9964|nr:alpha/beta hydrolase [Paenibacillus sp. SC116]MCR8845195.1 alpha/beta hydrolase [Paenibacillus sp. SC116]
MLWLLLLSGFGAFVLLSLCCMPRIAVHQMTRMKRSSYDNCLDLLEEYQIFSRQQFNDLQKEEVRIQSHDGLQLYGTYIELYPHSKRTMIFVHGYTGALPWSSQFIDMFAQVGFNALLIDQRSHGNSEGKYATFGYMEKYDVQAWVDWVVRRNGDDSIIGLHGQSLGGGTALEYVTIHRPQVRFIVADCPYSDLTQLIRHQVVKLNRAPAWPLMPLIDRLLKRKAAFEMNDVSPIRAIAQSKLPILFIHGAADIFVPTKMSEDLYAVKPEPKELLLVDKATHGVSHCRERELYRNAVINFVTRYVGLPSQQAESIYSAELSEFNSTLAAQSVPFVHPVHSVQSAPPDQPTAVIAASTDNKKNDLQLDTSEPLAVFAVSVAPALPEEDAVEAAEEAGETTVLEPNFA